jgi:hypothetical protein
VRRHFPIPRLCRVSCRRSACAHEC